MSLEALVPRGADVSMPTLAKMRERVLPPFSQEALDFCDALSQALFARPDAKPYPEMQALAFWLRRASVHKLREDFRAHGSGAGIVAPRGLVFHVAPGNVDTIFVYSWIMAMLSGNANVVRVSHRAGRQTTILCRIMADVLNEPRFANVREATRVVTYGHDAAITAALSAIADLRVIWGGDETIRQIRLAPLPAGSRDVTFHDRFSLCAMSAPAFLALDSDARLALADRFYNDAYWFDQGACSSPRALAWVGAPHEIAEARAKFWPLLSQIIQRRGYRVDDSLAVEKLVFASSRALDEPVASVTRHGNELFVLALDAPRELPRAHCGGGLFYELGLATLDALAPLLRAKDQTLTQFGFARATLDGFAAGLNGRAIDRIVPVGDALTFDRFWDGYDLLAEFTRIVHVRPGARGP